MEFILKINYVEKIKEYNGMSEIIHAINWTYICTKSDDRGHYLRTMHGVANLDLPNSKSFVALESIDYNVLKSWLESVLDFDAMKKRLEFLMTVPMSPHMAPIVQGTNALNQI